MSNSDISIYHVVNNVSNNTALTQLQNLQANSLANVINNFPKTRYTLSKTEEDYLNQHMSPFKIIYDTHVNFHQHGAAAFLNDYAYRSCLAEAKRFNNVIDIGGSPLRTPNNFHMCVKIDDIRTDGRYVENAWTQLNINTDKYSFTKYLTGKHNYCIDGAEKCMHKAEYAFAVNVYDITMADIAKIFSNHNLTVMDMWLFMPYNLIDDKFIDDQVIYRNKIIKDAGMAKCYFDLLDESNVYIHDYKTWKSYYETTIISCANYCIKIEIKRTIGAFTHFRFVRTTKMNGRIVRNIPLSFKTTKCIVPDLVHYFRNNNATANIYERSYNTQKQFVQKCLHYLCSTKDDMFNYNTFSAYCDSIKNTIKYNQNSAVEFVYEGVDMLFQEFETIKQSMFIIAAIERYKRTQFVSNALQYMKNNTPKLNAHSMNLSIRLKHEFKTMMHNIAESIKSFGRSINYDENVIIADTFLYNATIHYFEDKVFEKIYHTDEVMHLSHSTTIVIPNNTYTSFEQNIQNNNNKQRRNSNNSMSNISNNSGISDYQLAATEIMKSTEKLNNKISTVIYNCIDNKINTGKNMRIQGDELLFIANDHKFKLLYDPPGDGKCGLHCLSKFMDIDETNNTWQNIDDLNTIASTKGYNLIYHIEGTPVSLLRNNDDGDWISLNLRESHWTVISCNCLVKDRIIKPIEDFIHSTQFIYLTSFNNKGHLKALFTKLFDDKLPTYRNALDHRIIKDNWLDFDVVIVEKYDDHQSIINMINYIMAKINNHYERTLIIPSYMYTDCMGTILEGENYKYVVTSPVMIKQHNHCSHGGYKHYKQIVIDQGNKYNNVDYQQIATVKIKDKMQAKYDDIMSFISKIHNFKTVHDLTAAPGQFYEHHIKNYSYLKIIPYVYIGDNYADTMYNNHVIISYTDINELIQQLSIKSDLYLFDYYAYVISITSILHIVNNKGMLLTKISFDQNYKDKNVHFLKLLTDNNIKYNFMRNDATDSKSSELFIAISLKLMNNGIIDYSILQNEIDISVLEKQENYICKCKHDLFGKVNCNYTVTYDKVKMSNYQNWLNIELKNYDIQPYNNKNTKDLTIKVINGMAGAKKTMDVIKNICNKCSIIISPYKAVTNDTNRINNVGLTYMTAIKALHKNKYKYVILDEVFAHSPNYIYVVRDLQPEAIILGVGDSYQINDRDYNNDSLSINIEMLSDYINVTYRCPKKITEIISKYIKGATTKNDNDGEVKIEEDINKLYELPYDKDNLILCATQLIKDKIKLKNKNDINTINAAQGITVKNIHWYIQDIHMLPEDKVKYIYVAMSRCTNRLVMYGDKEEVQQIYTILGTAVDRATHVFDIPIVERTEFVRETPPHKYHTHVRQLGNKKVTQNSIEDTLDRIFIPTNDTTTSVIDYKTDVIIQDLSQKRFKMTMDMMGPDVIKIQGKRFGRRQYQKFYHGKNTKQTLDCLLHRYSKPTKKMSDKMIDKHIEGFDKFMKKDWIKNIRKQMTPEIIMSATTAYIRELQKKFPKEDVLSYYDYLNNKPQDDAVKEISKIKDKKLKNIIKTMMDGKESKLTDLEREWDDSYHQLINFHLKRQPKEVRSPGYDSIFKAGQGVSAWSKLMNIIFSTFTRVYDSLIKNYVLDNVQISYGESDAALGKFFETKHKIINSKSFEKMMCDFTEFDSSQNEKAMIASVMMLKAMGLPSHILDHYLHRRKEWVLYVKNNTGAVDLTVYLDGVWNQHSGQPFTLGGNTQYNMSAIGMCYNFKDFQFAAFKGDDSVVVAAKIEECLEGTDRLQDLCGYKLKAYKVNIMEYIANIITPCGFFPDVIRRVSRILSKIYVTNDDWEEIRKSTADCLDVIQDDEALHIGLEVAKNFYAQFNIMITIEELEDFVRFLKQIVNSKGLDEIDVKMWHIETLKH